MKHTFPTLNLRRSNDRESAFTLVEMLVVISIIAILAALLLPTLGIARRSAQKRRASLEATQIAGAIQRYESAYSRWPVSTAAVTASGTNDVTFGTNGVANCSISGPRIQSAYQANNSEVMAIVMDNTTWAGGVNFNHQKNPQQEKFLTANTSGDTSSSGVGLDGVYRDPWGNPYIITLDLNGDGVALDPIYGAVSAPVLVWSAGPDKAIGATPSDPANKDNILSWKGQ